MDLPIDRSIQNASLAKIKTIKYYLITFSDVQADLIVSLESD